MRTKCALCKAAQPLADQGFNLLHEANVAVVLDADGDLARGIVVFEGLEHFSELSFVGGERGGSSQRL